MDSPTAEPWTPLEKRFLVAALVAAYVLRLLHWQSFAQHSWFDFLGLDAKFYDEWAQRILREGLQAEDPYFMGPLYPHLLALVYGTFGRSLDAVRHLQLGLSVATVGLVHQLARRHGGRALAMVASGMAAVYGPFVYYSTAILYPTLTIFLATALLLLLHEAARRRSLRLAFAAGAVLGTFALGRGNILAFAPFAFAWLVSAWGRPLAPRLAAWREGLPAGGLLAAGTVLLILPATIHNARTGDPAFLTTNGGLNFYIGNGPMASGGHQTPVLYLEREDGTVERIEADLHKDVECRREAELALGRPLSYTEVSSFWFRETLRFISGHPGTFLSKLVMKAVHFWSTYEIPQIEHFGYLRRYSLPLRGPVLSFAILGPLAVLGMALGLRQPRKWALLYLFVFAYSASIVLFFVLARYRLPIVPALVPFAAAAVLEIHGGVRRKQHLLVGGSVAGAALVAWLMQANFYGVDVQKGIAQILYRHGIVEDASGDYEAAILRYREALQLKPGYDKCHLNLGADLARLGRLEEAMQHLEKAEELNPAYYRAPFNRGVLLEQLDRHDEARKAYARSMELEPRYLLGIASLAEMDLVAGDLDGARENLRQVLEYDGRWEGEHNPAARARAARLASYLRERDRLARAGRGQCFAESRVFRLAEIARVRQRVPEALGRLRTYFAQGGQCAEAYRALGRILLEIQELPGAEDALQRALDADAGFPGVHLTFARVAAIRGDAEAALRHLEEEIRIDPADPEAYLETGLVFERMRGDSARAEEWFERYRKAGGSPAVLEGRRAHWAAVQGGRGGAIR